MHVAQGELSVSGPSASLAVPSSSRGTFSEAF